MNSRTILHAFYAGFLAFSVLSLFFGSTGLSSMEKVNDRRRAVAANMENLDSRHEDLAGILSSLRTDPEAVVVEARSLGLYRKGENVVYFNTADTVKHRYEAGAVLRLHPLKRKDEGFIRIVALSMGLLVILTSLIRWKLNDASQ